MPANPVIVTRLRAAGCVFAEEEALLLAGAARTAAELDGMVARRAEGVPLEQVVGWAEFCGLRIFVDPGVFVPRRRSEFLVETATSLARGEQAVVADLCCGTGALGVAVAARLGGTRLGGTRLHAADIDPAAVACARRNVEPIGGRVYQGDLFDPLPAGLRGAVTVLICNAPYVPTGEVGFMPAEARDHEPRAALDGGPDGLTVLRRVAARAPLWLAADGHLLVETSQMQAPLMARAMSAAGLAPRVHSSEESGATVVTGSHPLSRTIPAFTPPSHDCHRHCRAAPGQARCQAPAFRARRHGHRGNRGDGRAARDRSHDGVPVGASPRGRREHRGDRRCAVSGTTHRSDTRNAPDRLRGSSPAPACRAAGLH